MNLTSEMHPLDPEIFRSDFPILRRMVRDETPLVYFDNAASTQRPRQVIQTIVDCYEKHYANVHRGIHQLAQESDQMYEEAREKVRRLLNAPSVEQCIFTYGTTSGINLVAQSWGGANIRPGDEILLSEMEHHANLVPWQQLATRTGAVLRHIPLSDDGLLRMDLLDTLLSGRTKLVSITAVSNVLGTINPIDEIIRRAHDAGALVMIDGAQSVPHQVTDVVALDCDFLAFSGHKMLGPTGIGVLYGKRELLEAMPPFLGGGSMIGRVMLDRFEPAALPMKFEAGTPPIVEAISLGAAIDYLQSVGLEAIGQHERRLVARAHELLEPIEGLRILGPSPEKKAGIVSFAMDHVHPHDIAEILDRRGIAIRAGHHCAMPLHKRYGLPATARASFYLYNTLDEVEKLGPAIEAVKQKFARTPGGRRRRKGTANAVSPLAESGELERGGG